MCIRDSAWTAWKAGVRGKLGILADAMRGEVYPALYMLCLLYTSYASRFASREAVIKALGTGFSQGVGRKDVSVTRDKLGKPQALLSGRALEIAQELGVVEVALSITPVSYTHLSSFRHRAQD